MAVAVLDDRFKKLNQCLRDNSGILYVEGLLDAVLAVFNDCNHSTLRRNKNLEIFRKRYEPSVPLLTSNRMSPTDFKLIQVIGRGAFGEVQLVRMKESKKLYAMKILSKYEMIRRSDTAFFWEERDIMAYTKSQWIVQLHYAFQDTENLYMVMDYMAGGNMVSLMERYEIPESWAQFYVAELVLALDAVHSMGYVHRDVKPENMLMDAKGHLKLADFGTCMKLDAKGKVRSETAVGTPDYISPEVLKSQGGEGYYGVECDWWSVGVVTYEMLIGDLPFFSESLMGTYSNIMNHKNTLQFKDSDNITVSARKLITQLLEDSDHRLRIAEIKEHTFFKTDQWTWSTINTCVPPVQPELISETDTQYFDEIEDSTPPQQSFAPPVEFQGNHLPFVGFTFLKEKNIIEPEVDAIDDGGQADSKDAGIRVLEKANLELKESVRLLEVKYKTVFNENAEFKSSLIKVTQNLNEVTKDLGIARIDLKEATRIKDELMEAKRMLEAQVVVLESHLNRNDGVESPTKLMSELDELRGQLQLEAESSSSLKAQNRELRKDLGFQEGMVERLDQRCRNLASDKEQLETTMEDLKCQVGKEKVVLEARNQDLCKQVSEKEEALELVKGKLSGVGEELQSMKNTQAEREMTNKMLKNNLQTLQQKYDALLTNHEVMVQKTDEDRLKMSSSKNYEKIVRDESEARQHAEERIGSLQHQSSLLELDLAQKKDEVTCLQDSIKEFRSKLSNETKRRTETEQKMKKMEEEHQAKLSQKEQEMRAQMNEMKMERQNLEDNVYRLKSEIKMSEQSLREARQEVEEEQKQRSILKGKLAELQTRTEGEGNDKELARQRIQVSELNVKLTHALQAKAMAESKLADFEKEKMMIELDVKETIARHKTEVTERMAWAAKIREQLMVAEVKLNQRNLENNDLQENLNRALMKLEKFFKSESNQEDEFRKLNQQLENEKVLKKEAVNKLTQVMFQRQSQVKGGGGSQKPEPRKSHEREIRKLKGDLQQETQKCKQVVEKYNHQLEEIQRQIIEEAQMRRELQTQLQQSESKLKALQQGIGSGNYVLNGPSTETDGNGSPHSNILPIQERETLIMQVPKGNDARKKGWRDVFVVLSYVAKKLMLYNNEDEMGTQVAPHLLLEFEQIYSVRTLEQGEHERARVKHNDAKRIIQLAYEEGTGGMRVNRTDDFEGVVHIRGHHFMEARNSSRSSCDVCGKTLPLALLSGGIFECKGCQMKCHKDDIDKVDLIQPCVVGEENQKKLLLLIKNDEQRSHWLSKLMAVTVSPSVTSTATRTTSPNLMTQVANKHRDRGGSVRFSGKRPSSAAQSKPSPPGVPSRTNSVSQHRRQLSKDSPLMGSNRQLDLVRNMGPDNTDARSQ